MPRTAEVKDVVVEVVKAINVNDFERRLESVIKIHTANFYDVSYEYKPLMTSKDQVMHIALVKGVLS